MKDGNGGGEFKQKIPLVSNELMNAEGNMGVPKTFTKKRKKYLVEHSEK